ncbi:MAG: hypothetical protein UR99_C0015G0001 [Candidatus Moranbacteria bacterium GW2011_GWD2_36_12]|nr:MAG: hypothetical protein UR99_C0015G0001 [Candidatus Moranbacteria bacterium GW2011_GWD2_36_12]KKQ06367.1 MAG: hypothetical protein US16_C0018G0001 [Candidatus Moranbacteria bacterium GW2011_GWE2_36_40]
MGSRRMSSCPFKNVISDGVCVCHRFPYFPKGTRLHEVGDNLWVVCNNQGRLLHLVVPQTQQCLWLLLSVGLEFQIRSYLQPQMFLQQFRQQAQQLRRQLIAQILLHNQNRQTKRRLLKR